MCRVVLAVSKLEQSSTKNLLQQRFFFSSQSRGKRYRDTNVVHALRDRENPQKILERKVGLVVQAEKDAPQKLYQAEAETEAKKVGKAKSGLLFSRNQSRV